MRKKHFFYHSAAYYFFALLSIYSTIKGDSVNVIHFCFDKYKIDEYQDQYYDEEKDKNFTFTRYKFVPKDPQLPKFLQAIFNEKSKVTHYRSTHDYPLLYKEIEEFYGIGKKDDKAVAVTPEKNKKEDDKSKSTTDKKKEVQYLTAKRIKKVLDMENRPLEPTESASFKSLNQLFLENKDNQDGLENCMIFIEIPQVPRSVKDVFVNSKILKYWMEIVACFNLGNQSVDEQPEKDDGEKGNDAETKSDQNTIENNEDDLNTTKNNQNTADEHESDTTGAKNNKQNITNGNDDENNKQNITNSNDDENNNQNIANSNDDSQDTTDTENEDQNNSVDSSELPIYFYVTPYAGYRYNTTLNNGDYIEEPIKESQDSILEKYFNLYYALTRRVDKESATTNDVLNLAGDPGLANFFSLLLDTSQPSSDKDRVKYSLKKDRIVDENTVADLMAKKGDIQKEAINQTEKPLEPNLDSLIIGAIIRDSDKSNNNQNQTFDFDYNPNEKKVTQSNVKHPDPLGKNEKIWISIIVILALGVIGVTIFWLDRGPNQESKSN